jgi:leader peptidase (prepilin peptidase)/N-methyltransferase
MMELLMPLLMLAAGLAAGALVTLVARALPARGRLLARPICAEKDCDLPWAAASQAARALGFRQRCPTCGAGPARSDVLLELATGLIFAVLAFVSPSGSMLAVHAGFATLLMVILAIDLRHREVYLVLGYGGILLALLVAPMSMSGSYLSAAAGGVVGGLAFGGLYVLGRLIYRGGEPLGTGDITIAALLGAMAGFPNILTALLVGIFAGGIFAVALLMTGGSRKVFMPYGPALCLGGLWVMFFR